jgi:DNA-binding transcriptional ArsR family regulator
MKHLDVLESAGLVSVSRTGRERWNEISVDTLQEAETWIAQHFVATHTDGLELDALSSLLIRRTSLQDSA